MMHYEPDGRVIKPPEQRARELRYAKRIKLALMRYEAWKYANKQTTVKPI